MNRILGTLALALLLAAPALAQPVIAVQPNSLGSGPVTIDGVQDNYMWFNIVLNNTGGNPNIGGVSLAAMVGGTWAQQGHLSAPPNLGTGSVDGANRYNGIQWATLPGFGSNYAFGTAISSLTSTCDYPTSTSGVFGTLGSGGYLTFGIDNQYSKVTPVSNGMLLARLYFIWDGTPLGASTITVSLIAESGNTAQGPSIFTDSGNGYIGSEVFAAPYVTTLSAPTGALSITAVTSTTWVYQNTPSTTYDRHAVALTISATDTSGNSYYTVTVTQTGSGVVTPTLTQTNSGTLVLVPPEMSLTWTQAAAGSMTCYLVGGRTNGWVNSTANLNETGNCNVTVTVVGDQTTAANPATATATVFVRPLGDILNEGPINSLDANEFVNWLNGQKGDTKTLDPEVFDVDGGGNTLSSLQLNLLILILNGHIIP